MKISNVRLLTTKFEESYFFYKDKMGLEVTWGKPTDVYASFKLPGGGDIGLFDRALMAQSVGTTNLPAEAMAQDQFTLILEVENLDETHQNFVSKGIEFINPPTKKLDWGIEAAHFRDLEGNLIEIMSPLKG